MYKAYGFKKLIPLPVVMAVLSASFTLSARAQDLVLPPHESAESTTVIQPSLIDNLAAQEAETPLSSSPVRVIESTDNHIGVYVLSSETSDANRPSTGGYHRNVAEVYRVINGTGVFMTGGQLQNPSEVQVGTNRYEQSGPGATGTIDEGRRIEYTPGTIIIVPPGVPHNALYRVDTPTDYLVYRYDPNNLLPLQ